MFILHSSNKTENLLEHLCTLIKQAPLTSPFAKETFLIQSQGMERWLCQQLAMRFPVWANFQFLFPGKFFSYIAQQIDSRLHDLTFERSRLIWRFETLLRDLHSDEYEQLQAYLSGVNVPLKRYQLAQQLAQLFDQYQIMRPDLLSAWQNDTLLYAADCERWQKKLWHMLTAHIGNQHRGKLWQDVISKLMQSEAGSFEMVLPERICIFGINTMPPLFLSYLQALAKHCQIHLFLLNPSQVFWGDLDSKRQQQFENTLNHHPLLTGLAQQGREFQSLLLDLVDVEIHLDSFESIEQANVLQQLQNDILHNAINFCALTNDRSISIHACHSRKREVEVLKDQLLAVLESTPDLELRDIVVMAPDIQQYEPYIAAVFHDIQHSVADRSLRQDNRILDTFIQFLTLSQSRLGWQSVLDFLALENIYPSFGLSDSDLELINFWIQDMHVRWGQSAQHKFELGLPAFSENTWQAALERLLMGYAVGHDNEFVFDILPYPHIEGTDALVAGGLYDFVQLLFQAKQEFAHAKTLSDWGKRFGYFINRLFGHVDFNERHLLYELIAELSSDIANFHQDLVELSTIRYWLENQINEQKSANGFLRGQLTFCSMLPMRSIPFKVIALMGMNEGDYPKIDRHPTFDLIALYNRKGDRSRRVDDRYQFLEVLLSARQQLLITYVGQSQADNSIIPPSVAVAELINVLESHYRLDNLITYHPLQAFSAHYFTASSDLSSYSQAHYAIAQALQHPPPTSNSWWQGALPTPELNVVEVTDLLNFFSHPQRYFFRRQLGLRLSGIVADAEEREAFSMNDIETFGLNEELINQTLNHQPLSAARLSAQGLWMPGALGDTAFEQHVNSIQTFVERIRESGMTSIKGSIDIDLAIDGFRLIGKCTHAYDNGLLFYRYANLKGKDFLNAWLQHLIVNAIEPQTTVLLSADKTIQFTPALIQPDYLPAFLQLYWRGQQQPDAFFTEAAFAYMLQAVNLTRRSDVKKSAIAAAQDQLLNAISSSYEYELNRLFADIDSAESLLSEDFVNFCETLLVPVWENCNAY